MALTVTVTPVAGDPPRAQVAVSGIPAGTDRIQVRRRSGGRTLPAPRMSRQIAGTSVTVVDYEVPLGTTVTYEITALAPDGGIVDSGASTSWESPHMDRNYAWLSDPLDETSPIRVPCLVGTDRERHYPTAGEVVSTMSGRRSASMGSRAGLSVWPMTLEARTEDEARALRRLLTGGDRGESPDGGPASILVRMDGSHQLPPLMFGFGFEPVEAPGHIPTRAFARWHVELSVTDGPALATVIRRWTCADLLAFGLAEGLTWGTISTVFPTVDALALGPEYL